MKNLIIIAAISDNNVIGINNKLPWNIPEDMRRFKALTTGNTIVMGRKTFESIGKPLAGRENIVLTRNPDYDEPKVLVAHTIEEALAKSTRDNVFAIGGEAVYRLAIPIANRMELTRIHSTYNGNIFFPEIEYSQWRLNTEINNGGFSFLSYSRK